MTPNLQLTSVTIGCPNPRELVQFYARLLDAEITAIEQPREGEPENAGWAQFRTTGDRGTITLNFEFERQWRAPIWPSEPERQHITQHLDIHVDDLDGAVAWAVECGARQAKSQPQETVRVMIDPVGHPFCLFT